MPTTPPRNPVILQHKLPWYKTLKSFFAVRTYHWSYYFRTARKQYPYSNHCKTTQPTPAFPRVWILTRPKYAHLPMSKHFDLTCVQTSTSKTLIRTQPHKHAHGLTETHICIQPQKSLSLIPNYVPFLSDPYFVRTRFNKKNHRQ